MASLHFSALIVCSFLWVSLISPTLSQKCSSLKFANSNTYQHCLDLPTLGSYLHFIYNSSNSTLAVAFAASPSTPNGWISWAINPVAPAMAGAQALIAYKNGDGSITLDTYNISGYTGNSIVKGKLAFDVWDTSAEVESGGVVRIFAKVKVPAELAATGKVNHVWQVGPGVQNGRVFPHDMGTQNLQAKGTLDLNGGQSTSGGGVLDTRTKKKNIHGVLNAVSWGILFPAGVIFARYLRTFQSADPAWFYLHVFCQVSAYAIGVAGWATGLQLGSQSKGIQWTGHRNIGIALFSFATLQIFALLLRPKKDHKYRSYWNLYHHGVGYAIVILGILNVFKGLDILQPEEKWRTAYIVVVAVLGGIAVLLELITWGVVLKRKSTKSTTKPYDGYNVQSREEPLTA